MECLCFIHCCLISYLLFTYLLEGEVTFKAAACSWQPLGCRLHVNSGWALTLSIPGILWRNLCPLISVLFKSRSLLWVARLGLEAWTIKSCRENVSLVMQIPLVFCSTSSHSCEGWVALTLCHGGTVCRSHSRCGNVLCLQTLPLQRTIIHLPQIQCNTVYFHF